MGRGRVADPGKECPPARRLWAPALCYTRVNVGTHVDCYSLAEIRGVEKPCPLLLL